MFKMKLPDSLRGRCALIRLDREIPAPRRGETKPQGLGNGALARTPRRACDLRADILSWSRSQGLFAGLALEGATLRQDLDDNATLYGKKLENRDIVTSGVRPPKAAAKLIALLNRYSTSEARAELSLEGEKT